MILRRYIIILFAFSVLFGIIIFNNYKENNYETLIGTVLEIKDDKIILVEDNSDKEYYYCLEYEVKVNNNRKNIKLGDVVKIKYPEKYYEKRNTLYINNLTEIKSFKIVGQNLKKIENTHYYNSIDNISLVVNKFTSQGISFTITDNNRNPYKYLDKYKIYKYNDKEVSKNNKFSETKIIESSKLNENVVSKAYDWTDMYGNLEERKIYVCIYNR